MKSIHVYSEILINENNIPTEIWWTDHLQDRLEFGKIIRHLQEK